MLACSSCTHCISRIDRKRISFNQFLLTWCCAWSQVSRSWRYHKFKMHPVLKTVISLFVLGFLLFLNTLKFILSPVLRAIFAPRKALTIRTPDSRFSGLEKYGYTFTPNYVDLPMGGEVCLPRMHYIDEGPKDAQETILCLHGEPAWSFLYRKMIPTLVQARYRVIVPDFIGFGKSDKYTSAANYTHELHTASLRMLIDHLELTNITLVCQDWGGLTGLSVVKDIPDKFCSLVVMNTGLPTGDLAGEDSGSPATKKSILKQIKSGMYIIASATLFLN